MVRLDTDTLTEDLPYATLSYCWGGDQEGKTLRANLSSRLDGFDLSGQPKTIQDAVKISRALGIRFVWIDSLCIVQDDDDDKVHEITRMHDIYRYSYLTISASRASSSQKGFLSLCKPVDPIRLAYRGPDGRLGSVILSSVDMVREPIHSRAWTLQEHALSARLLIFGTFGMRWVCRAGPRRDSEQENSGHFRNRIAEHLHAPTSTSNLVGEWHDLVVGYSSRALTNVDDRLPAVSAMATMHSTVRKDSRYLAGLWSDSLPRDLLWNVFSTTNWAGGLRNQHSSFPSWSWASVRGPIGGFTPMEHEDVVTISVFNSDVTLRNATAPFGQVESGSLVVEGRLFVVRQSSHQTMDFVNSGNERVSDAYQNAVVHVQCCRSEPGDDTGDMAAFDIGMDYPTQAKSLKGYYCLEIMSDSSNPRTSKGLLLRPVHIGSREMLSTRVGQYTPTFPKDTADIKAWAQQFKMTII